MIVMKKFIYLSFYGAVRWMLCYFRLIVGWFF